MLFYQCKCGERTYLGAMPPPPCAKCYRCGSGLSTDTEYLEPRAHDFSPGHQCRYCRQTREEIASSEEVTKPDFKL